MTTEQITNTILALQKLHQLATQYQELVEQISETKTISTEAIRQLIATSLHMTEGIIVTAPTAIQLIKSNGHAPTITIEINDPNPNIYQIQQTIQQAIQQLNQGQHLP